MVLDHLGAIALHAAGIRIVGIGLLLLGQLEEPPAGVLEPRYELQQDVVVSDGKEAHSLEAVDICSTNKCGC